MTGNPITNIRWNTRRSISIFLPIPRILYSVNHSSQDALYNQILQTDTTLRREYIVLRRRIFAAGLESRERIHRKERTVGLSSLLIERISLRVHQTLFNPHSKTRHFKDTLPHHISHLRLIRYIILSDEPLARASDTAVFRASITQKRCKRILKF